GAATAAMKPAPTSPALDAGDPGFAPPPAVDQRGKTRPSGGRVDMGAVELQTIVAPPPPKLQASSDTGASTTDQITRDNTPTFDVTGTAGGTVTLWRDGVSTGIHRAGDGAITDTGAPADGAHTYAVTQTSSDDV